MPEYDDGCITPGERFGRVENKLDLLTTAVQRLEIKVAVYSASVSLITTLAVLVLAKVIGT